MDGSQPSSTVTSLKHRRAALLALTLLVPFLGACSVAAVLSALTPNGGAVIERDIVFDPANELRLDIYRPDPTNQKNALQPVVIFFYGGSWNSGDRATYAFVGEALAARGIVTVVPDYRLFPQVRFPEFLHDSATAVGWVARHAARYGANPNRIFLAGHSAGAYNAAMLALNPKYLSGAGVKADAIAGFIGLAGPYNFLPVQNPDVKPVFFHPDYPPGTQPVSFVSAAAPPALLAAARQDDLVNPTRNSLELANRLRAARVPTEIRFYDRVSHASLVGAYALPLRWLAPILEDTVAFVQGRPTRRAADN